MYMFSVVSAADVVVDGRSFTASTHSVNNNSHIQLIGNNNTNCD